MITKVFFAGRYYLYTRVGSSGRGLQVSELGGNRYSQWLTVRVRRTLIEGEPISVIGGGYWRR
jgi:hypothetical protein